MIVQVPAPTFRIVTVSPAANKLVFTVIVVAEAFDIVIEVPASAATSVKLATFALAEPPSIAVCCRLVI